MFRGFFRGFLVGFRMFGFALEPQIPSAVARWLLKQRFVARRQSSRELQEMRKKIHGNMIARGTWCFAPLSEGAALRAAAELQPYSQTPTVAAHKTSVLHAGNVRRRG